MVMPWPGCAEQACSALLGEQGERMSQTTIGPEGTDTADGGHSGRPRFDRHKPSLRRGSARPQLVIRNGTRLEPGLSTAHEQNVHYRVSRIADLLHGRWLDYGCADGGYASALLQAGVTWLDGIDVEHDRVEAARARNLPNAQFHPAEDRELPFEDATFDGVFMNEVLEHVHDEQASLREVRRVLKPGGRLVLISPNRWFPFEGHGVRWRKWTFSQPTPLVPWLPARVSRHVLRARNYWPQELRAQAQRAGLDVVETSFIWPVFEHYPWIPRRTLSWYRKRLPSMHRIPAIRRFGVSTMVIAIRPALES